MSQSDDEYNPTEEKNHLQSSNLNEDNKRKLRKRMNNENKYKEFLIKEEEILGECVRG